MDLLSAYLTRPATQRILSKKPGQEGFSLIELVVVIAVLAILAVIALPNFTGVTNSATAQSMKTALTDVYKQCEVMKARGTPVANRTVIAPNITDVTFSPLTSAVATTAGTTHVNCAGPIQAGPTAGGSLAAPAGGGNPVVPTFILNTGTAAKTCTGLNDFGCTGFAGTTPGTW